MPQVRCPRCATVVEHAAGFQPVCPTCGYGAAPTAPAAAYGVPPQPAPPSQAIAIVALLLNLLIWPGLGSLIASRIGVGLAQGFLFLLGVILIVTVLGMIVGIPLVIAMWVWGLVTGIQLLQAASAARPTPMPQG